MIDNIEESKPNQNASNSSTKSNAAIFLYGLLGLIVAALLVTAGVGIYRVYAKSAADSFSVTVAKALRLPAFKINGEKILYFDYAADMKAIKTMRDYDKANNGPGASLTDEQMSDQVLWRLANLVLVKDAANKYNVVVADSDVNELKTQMLQQFKNDSAAAESELQKRYGWTMAQYEDKVMRPFILQSKLAEKIQADQGLQAEVRKKAGDVLQQIKNGASFADMAKQYGSDGTAANGGDLGWFGKGEMVPEFEKAAFSLKKGELDPTLAQTNYGYHIIRLDDKKVETSKDKNGKVVKADKVRASHILFRYADLGQYLDSQAKQAKIQLYIKVHNPFAVLKNQKA